MISLERIWKTAEVRKSILFVLAMVVLFRLTTHVPIPGIDASALSKLFQGNQFFGLLDIFSGGALKSFSVMALGVGPYITASIIFQLLGMIVPKFEEMQKEERGRQKINQWSRLLTVPLAALQGYSILLLLQQQKAQILQDMSPFTIFLAILSMMAGTMFLMWIGELISERKVGNGISLVIFAGIVAGLPTFFSQALSVYDPSQIITAIAFFVVVLVTVACIVVMNEAQTGARGAALRGREFAHADQAQLGRGDPDHFRDFDHLGSWCVRAILHQCPHRVCARGRGVDFAAHAESAVLRRSLFCPCLCLYLFLCSCDFSSGYGCGEFAEARRIHSWDSPGEADR